MNSPKKVLLATLKYIRIDQLGSVGEWFVDKIMCILGGVVRNDEGTKAQVLCPLLRSTAG